MQQAYLPPLRVGDLKLFELIAICPLVALRDRAERYRSLAKKVHHPAGVTTARGYGRR